ncbi:lactate utilization protein C [Sedimentitalea sp. HM32M-2]|uniref:LutC/YkgG family protein n=1 Tax=Sedimentitalea sp. HM32M-2 TaxID=3351566 RepID=UPI00363700E3
MSEARDAIFQAIRGANGPLAAADRIAAEAKALIGEPAALRPGFTGQNNLDRFIEKATSERVTATVSQVAALADVPAEVAAYLDRVALPGMIALQPRAELTGLDWGDIRCHNEPAANEPVAVTIADLAVAETGSVVFGSARDAPTLMNFLPLHHVVVVRQSLIRRHLEDVFDFVGPGQRNQPRNLTIVTGTSGTADIEAKNIRGAHGPRFMHLIIVQ